VVHLKDPHRHGADVRQGTNHRGINRKVLGPVVYARMKEPAQLSGLRRQGREIGALITVAEHASVGQIVRERLATMFFGDDVLDSQPKNVSASWIRQYSHRPSARSATNRRNAAGT
jgi:hypothetical protein